MEISENHQMNGNCEKIVDSREEKFFFNYDHMDNKSENFEMNFNGNGAYTDDEERENDENDCYDESNRIRALEEEQESLLSSLMALTTHFAQVQFRLHQIVEAPEKERDVLLKKLEDFADRGIPNFNEHNLDTSAKGILSKMDCQKYRQQELIDQLKTQLDDLEKYAYETGEPVLPQAIMMEKQKIIIDELKQKMNLNFNELDLPQLSPDELRNHVDAAIGEFVSPLKMKEQLVAQLKTQVNDLERFIKFLQVEKTEKKKMLKQQLLKKQNCSDIDLHNQSCNCNFNKDEKSNAIAERSRRVNVNNAHQPTTTSSSTSSTLPQLSTNGISDRFFQMFNKASTIFQIFALSQIGCASQNGRNFKRNILKKTSRGNHWGDIRAKLEVDIQEIVALVKVINMTADNENKLKKLHDTEADTEDDDVFIKEKPKSDVQQQPTATTGRKLSRYRSNSTSSSIMLPPPYSLSTSSKSDELKSLNFELIALVRKKFAVTLQKLIQHGLRSVNETRHLVPFIGCFYNFQTNPSQSLRQQQYPDEDYTEMHAWELILEYYNLKNGDFYTETPAQLLSQSFNLDIGDGLTSNKQTLLLAIRNIINLHSPYKRGYNSHFKAFICAGLNSHKLVQWLNLIFQCHELVSTYYTSWSYVAQTGFRDALKSIDQLTKFEFYDLPVDLAIRNLANIKDVFS
ncbi:hypothetical protein PVAND_012321 [Polypedilum vanderplanki]|uniref:RUN domain-containing protein n=1 Tax=Polypedilum vanderplanki TaxID=319348 RepID=A0A9J6CN06_POLVA|nr:hypothetical protein PVAND_012321 [Polypedilum vanderplanki]